METVSIIVKELPLSEIFGIKGPLPMFVVPAGRAYINERTFFHDMVVIEDQYTPKITHTAKSYRIFRISLVDSRPISLEKQPAAFLVGRQGGTFDVADY